MDFEFKITTWEKVTVDEKHEEMIKEKIINGEITSANDIFKFVEDATCEKIDDVDEQMTLEENGGMSTIEIFNDDNELIWQNGE